MAGLHHEGRQGLELVGGGSAPAVLVLGQESSRRILRPPHLDDVAGHLRLLLLAGREVAALLLGHHLAEADVALVVVGGAAAAAQDVVEAGDGDVRQLDLSGWGGTDAHCHARVSGTSDAHIGLLEEQELLHLLHLQHLHLVLLQLLLNLLLLLRVEA